jgi:hypothetical protein
VVAVAGLGLLDLIAYIAQAVTVAAELLLQSLVHKPTTLEEGVAVDILRYPQQVESVG